MKATDTSSVGHGTDSAVGTIRRGLSYSPEIRAGLGLTLVLALVATAGRVVVPIAVQQTVDRGLLNPAGPDLGFVRWMCLAAGIAVLVTAGCAYLMNVRLFRTTECGLATLRVRAFRHVHDLSVLTQNAERRGSLVSRVTSDVDTISHVHAVGRPADRRQRRPADRGDRADGRLLVAAHAAGLGLLPAALPAAARLPAPGVRGVRRWSASGSATCSAPSPSRSSAPRWSAPTRSRSAPGSASTPPSSATGRAATRAQRLVALTFSTGEVVAGHRQRRRGRRRRPARHRRRAHARASCWPSCSSSRCSSGRCRSAPRCSTRRRTPSPAGGASSACSTRPADVADPGTGRVELPRGPIDVRFEQVSFAYPGGPTVLHDVDLVLAPRSRVAVVGETGSGKTTFAKLLTRLMDPVEGRVLVDGVDLRQVRFASLRARIVMVPQDGLPVRGDPSPTTSGSAGREPPTTEIELALTELGLADWLDGLPHGLAHRRRAARGVSSRRASASSSRWPAPTWPTPTCSCSTRRPAPSTRRPRCGSPAPSRGSPAAAPR